jgi:UDP-glucose 4-epimerase
MSMPIPWNDPIRRNESFRQNAANFASFSGDRPRTIIWAAGQGSVSTEHSPNNGELSAFADFAKVLSKSENLFGSQLVICSSAGGVYGGSDSPPFTIETKPVAINAYGQEKIDIEELAGLRLLPTYRVLIARITNLYGAWSGVRQGLVNRLCTAAVIREPIQIYVSLDTFRDYLEVNDAANLLLTEALFHANLPNGKSPHVCIIGSGRSTSVGEVIATVMDVSRRKIPISLANLSYRDLQPRDLRVLPTWLEHDPDFSPIELPAGVKRLLNSLVTAPRWT